MTPFIRRDCMLMMSVRRVSPLSRFRDSLQQLTGVADRAERIADFVRDARGKPTERGELQLLRLLLDFDGVFEKDDDVGVGSFAAAQR